ncbi:glycosyltransferase involved in cell wall biosynthesis [Sinomonas atrocyanea]|uniref:glycosyltransferase family 4 protein n=1 Tax=Sinomonas atrocyanea TaxID=37927 RepID=UPI002789A617|nr:glycosyltransferase family 4 protein [Sinomonas atrocyanea]MDP9885844.1 glycosyltransferase involved in cell wall biosynthesis [Sinomonas atrocyanea]
MTEPLSTVLVVALNYAPEPTGNAPYTTKLVEGLRGQGHDVRVLTGYPHYPWWRVQEGYTGLSRTELVNSVPVQRVRHTVPAAPRTLSRLLMEFTFGLHAVFVRWGEPDTVLVVSPALFSSGLAVLKARLRGKRVAIWVQDLYSRGLEETAGRRSIVSRAMRRVESAILSSCASVTVIHDRFRAYVVDDLNVPKSKVHVVRNWSHVQLPSQFDRGLARRELDWAEGEIIALHAGNMGVKQGLENVVEAARLASALGSPVKFVLLGDGNRRAALEEAGAGIPNLTFVRPMDDAAYSAALRAADVLLVNELADVREMSVPSKLTSYFATGLPVVAATHEESATSDEIRLSEGGVRVDPERPSVLLRAIEALGADPERATALGANGQRYALRMLSAEAAITAHERVLLSHA